MATGLYQSNLNVAAPVLIPRCYNDTNFTALSLMTFSFSLFFSSVVFCVHNANLNFCC